MATSGIWNHAVPTHSLAASSAAHPATAGTSSPTSGDGGSDISGNDFLTLLVTEMQNQDPTANTDPNEYINQLVQVNSLEQLISINQTLSSDSGTSATGGLQSVPVANSITAPLSANSNLAAPGSAAAAPGNLTGAASQAVAGNLGLPPATSAADRVAHALSLRTHHD